MKRTLLLLGLLSTLLLSSSVLAKPGSDKLWGKFNEVLSKTLTLELEIEVSDFKHTVTFATATDYVKLSRSVDGCNISLQSWIRESDDAFVLQVQCDVYCGQGKSSGGVGVGGDFSATLKKGDEAVLLKDKGASFTIRLKNAR